MKAVRMTFDEDLVEAAGGVSKRLHTNRSVFTRKALRETISLYSVERLERKHRQGCQRYPVTDYEFSVLKQTITKGEIDSLITSLSQQRWRMSRARSVLRSISETNALTSHKSMGF
jgi:metal-responsive CopG/Arc/MetJ family transcriptional regulator